MLILALLAVVYSATVGQPSFTSTAIAIDSAGDSYIAGHADQTGTVSFVNKLDAATGKVIWSATLPNAQIKTIAVNTKGEVHVGGTTTPAPVGYVAKLSADGSKILYSISLGHAQTTVTAMALDPAGNIYVTGDTNDRDFPTTPGSFQPKAPVTPYQGNIFLAKFTPDLSTQVCSTMLDGSLEEHARAIALDAVGNAFITGNTYSTDFPVTPGAYQTKLNASGLSGFVMKMDSSGKSLAYSTLLPSGIGVGIGIDTAGNAYVATSDGAVRKLDRGGASVLWQTAVTGTSGDRLNALAIDMAANTYVTGWTKSANLPLKNPLQACHFAGAGNPPPDAFLTALDSSAGSVVLLFGTGAGTTLPAQADGEVTPGPSPQSTAQLTAMFENGTAIVTPPFGGFPRLQTQYAAANLTYVGPAPSLVAGVTQVNVQVPALTANGRVGVVFAFQWHSVLSPATASVWVR